MAVMLTRFVDVFKHGSAQRAIVALLVVVPPHRSCLVGPVMDPKTSTGPKIPTTQTVAIVVLAELTHRPSRIRPRTLTTRSPSLLAPSRASPVPALGMKAEAFTRPFAPLPIEVTRTLAGKKGPLKTRIRLGLCIHIVEPTLIERSIRKPTKTVAYQEMRPSRRTQTTTVS